MLKTGKDLKISKLAEKSIVKRTKQDSTLFFNQKAKECFQNLKKAFFEGLFLQHFYLSQPIRLESNESGIAIRGVLWKKNIAMN